MRTNYTGSISTHSVISRSHKSDLAQCIVVVIFIICSGKVCKQTFCSELALKIVDSKPSSN